MTTWRRGERKPRYALGRRISRWVWAWALGIALVGGGCGGFAEQVRSDSDGDEDAQQEALETASDLYEAMVQIFEEETLGISEERQEALAVFSEYEEVGVSQRRRLIGQIVPLRGGLGVQIRAEYQVDVAEDDEPAQWQDRPREEVVEHAQTLERQMVRAVERRYHREFG